MLTNKVLVLRQIPASNLSVVNLPPPRRGGIALLLLPGSNMTCHCQKGRKWIYNSKLVFILTQMRGSTRSDREDRWLYVFLDLFRNYTLLWTPLAVNTHIEIIIIPWPVLGSWTSLNTSGIFFWLRFLYRKAGAFSDCISSSIIWRISCQQTKLVSCFRSCTLFIDFFLIIYIMCH